MQKMRAAGVPQRAIDVFAYYYGELVEGATGMIPEDSVDGLANVARADEEVRRYVGTESARAAAAQTVVVKLNGGLGTTMGLDRAKSLVPVRDGLSFLDVTATQVKHVRTTLDVALPIVFMNSFATHDDTMAAVAKHDLAVGDLPLAFLQNQEPKLLLDDLTPVSWPADPRLEWCPPGHGDLYTALETSGVLQALLDAGFRYATVSNSDNLGAVPDPAMMAWFAATGAPFAMEVCRRTEADVKGGQLVVRRSDGRLVLRETAQTPLEDAAFAADIDRHRYFNTNSLWFDLEQIATALADRGGVLGLPLIRNVKTVDPTDPSSPKVVQIESAMGAAIEVFEDAAVLEVERSRHRPVKSTDDLLVLRSDVYQFGPDGVVESVADPPLVRLDPRYFKTITDFEARIPVAPSLREAKSFTVEGDWTIGSDVVIRGDVRLEDEGPGRRIPDGARLLG
ncbi:MAG TPA: UTP--glucose-1-phosphate uridylyltransferase [Aeromicrobium sp.]|nr:UTP--glucose-1-phosphate uridylyltransferase [Aeromicrobium sp.]